MCVSGPGGGSVFVVVLWLSMCVNGRLVCKRVPALVDQWWWVMEEGEREFRVIGATSSLSYVANL